VAGHLAATGVRIGGGADRREEHLLAGHAELQTQRAVAIVEVEPVIRRPQDKARGRHDRFVPRARDLKKDLVLALELDLLVVEPPRQEHGAIRTDELVAREPRGGLALGFAGSGHDLKIETRETGHETGKSGGSASRPLGASAQAQRPSSRVAE
jgi:hypothetical protein